MSVTVEELNKQAALKEVEGEYAGEVDPDEERNLLLNDLDASCDLFKKVQIFLDYISEPAVCQSLTKRERSIAARLSETIDEQVDAIEQLLEE